MGDPRTLVRSTADGRSGTREDGPVSNMMNVDLARSMAADRDRYITDRDRGGPTTPRPGLSERFGTLLRRMRREVAAVAPAVVAPIALAVPEGVALDEVA